MKSNSDFTKTIGGLSAKYYFRNFVFGLIISAIGIFNILVTEELDPIVLAAVLAFFAINTLLYPYSRFVYESIVNFVMGENVFYVNALIMLLVKFFTMLLCWGWAVLIGPIGLLYLYIRQRKGSVK